MKAIKLLILIVVLGLQTAVDSIFGQRPEVYFSLQINDFKEIEPLNHQLYIDKVEAGYLLAYANRKQFEKLLENGHQPVLLTPPSMTGDYPVMLTVDDLPNRSLWNTYPTYEAYEAMMYQFAADYPELCTIHTVGNSQQQYP